MGYYPPPPGYEEPPLPERDPGIHLHDGFFLRMSIGGGWLKNKITGEIAGYDLELTVSSGTVPIEILIGGSPVPGFVIGGGLWADPLLSPKVESDYFDDAELEDTSTQFSRLGLFFDYYPIPQDGLNLQLSVAYAAFSVRDDTTDRLLANAKGVSVGGGVGYEWWIGNQWSAGVMGRFDYASLKAHSEQHSLVYPAVVMTFTYH